MQSSWSVDEPSAFLIAHYYPLVPSNSSLKMLSGWNRPSYPPNICTSQLRIWAHIYRFFVVFNSLTGTARGSIHQRKCPSGQFAQCSGKKWRVWLCGYNRTPHACLISPYRATTATACSTWVCHCSPLCPLHQVSTPLQKVAASICRTPETLHRATHTSAHPFPGFGNFQSSFPRATWAGRIQGQVLSTPISRELLTSVETALTHMRILILFRDTLELKSPQQDSWATKHIQERRDAWKNYGFQQ